MSTDNVSEITWKASTEERYYDMLCALPPEYMGPNCFLLGEPANHRRCEITGKFEPVFDGFRKKGETFEQTERPVTVTEFKNSRASWNR